MYCTYCGAKNNEGSKFCMECGKALIQSDGARVRSSSPESSSQTTITVPFGLKGKESKKRIATVGGAMVVICFFLPWILVSCSYDASYGMELSGFDMVTMSADSNELSYYSAYGLGDSSADDGSAMFILGVVIVPLFSAIGTFFLYKENRGLGLFFSAVALISLLLLSFMFADLRSSAMQEGFIVKFRIGFWGTWLGVILLVYGIYKHPSISRRTSSSSNY